MKYLKLGSSGVQISAISLGTLNLLNGYSKKEKFAIFDYAFDHGINYFDTAGSYEGGLAEEFLGNFIKNKDRSKILLGTKCFFSKTNSILEKGLTKKNIFHTVDTSLKRLHSDYIDVFYCHRYDSETSLEETLGAIQNLIDQGKILYWGVCSFSVFQLCEIYYKAKELGCNLPIIGQYPYNLFNRTIEMDLKEVISKLQLKVVGYYPLSQGILTGKYSKGIHNKSRAHHPELKKQMWDFSKKKIKKAEDFQKLAKKINSPPSALALKWCLHNPLVCSALTHANTISQLKENLGFSNIVLVDELLEEINAIFSNAPVNPYTGIKY